MLSMPYSQKHHEGFKRGAFIQLEGNKTKDPRSCLLLLLLLSPFRLAEQLIGVITMNSNMDDCRCVSE